MQLCWRCVALSLFGNCIVKAPMLCLGRSGLKGRIFSRRRIEVLTSFGLIGDIVGIVLPIRGTMSIAVEGQGLRWGRCSIKTVVRIIVGSLGRFIRDRVAISRDAPPLFDLSVVVTAVTVVWRRAGQSMDAHGRGGMPTSTTTTISGSASARTLPLRSVALTTHQGYCPSQRVRDVLHLSHAMRVLFRGRACSASVTSWLRWPLVPGDEGL